MAARSVAMAFPLHSTDIMNQRRFEEVIGGRVYHIEAALVRDKRWRAQIVRTPGVPTALMPFYGTTPDEAARQLREWLARAHRGVSAVPEDRVAPARLRAGRNRSVAL